MKQVKKLWYALLESIDRRADNYSRKQSEKNIKRYQAESERIYRIIEREGKAWIFINGKPASTGDDTERLVQRMFTMRQAYVQECLEAGQLL